MNNLETVSTPVQIVIDEFFTRKIFFLFASVLFVLTACSGTWQILPSTSLGAAATATAQSPTASAPPNTPAIQRIFVIVFENKDQRQMLANPYFADLARRGAFLSQYYSIAHPSQPNYIAMIGGDTFGIADDSIHNLPQSNLVDLLQAANVTWKAYQEDYPTSGACFANAASTLYVRKHNPFISFDDIRTNPALCARIVNAEELPNDIATNRLPAFSFYSPNTNNDGHNQSISFAANWLQGFLEPKLADPKFISGTLVVLTMDESSNAHDNPATVPIYTVLLGPMVHAGTNDPTRYTHYSLLRTIEEIFHLGSLNRVDATAHPFSACNFAGGCK